MDEQKMGLCQKKKKWVTVTVATYTRRLVQYGILIYAADRVGDRWQGHYMFPSDSIRICLPLTMDSISGTPRKAMHPTLLVYRTM